MLDKDFESNKLAIETYWKRIVSYRKKPESEFLDHIDPLQVKGVILLKQVAPKFFEQIVKRHPQFLEVIENNQNLTEERKVG